MSFFVLYDKILLESSDTMKGTGFTLIELLAVIVILAIIALIAVPIVLNIIEDSKKSSEKENIKLYMKQVETSIAKENLKERFSPKKCEIQTDGNLICNESSNKLEIDMNGTKPNDGIIKLKEGKIYKYRNVKIGDLYYHMNSNGIITTTKEPKFYTLCKSTTAEKSIELGTKYECEVIDDLTYNFYVLSTENDNKTINLIMDRNICEDGSLATQANPCLYAWHTGEANNSYGPDTAMTKLYMATKEWENVPNINLIYEDEGNLNNNDYGYGTIETTKLGVKITKKDGTELTREENQTPVILYEKDKQLKARLPKHSEVIQEDAECSTEYVEGSCAAWLVENLKNSGIDKYSSNSKISGIKGYWLMSSNNKDYPNIFAYDLRYSGVSSATGTSADNVYGIRPVITVSINDLSN